MSKEANSKYANDIKSISDLLLWKRCVFMTFEQYKKKREHINERIYYHEAITDNVSRHVIEHLKGLAGQLPFKKVPLPIYVLVAKHLQYEPSDSILPANCKQAYNLDYNLIKSEYNSNPSLADVKYSDSIRTSCYAPYTDLITGKLNYDAYKNNPMTCNYEVSCFKNIDNTFISSSDSKIQSFKTTYDKNVQLKNIRENANIACFQNKPQEWISQDDFNRYKFIYNSVQKNEEELMKSSIASYKFNKLFEVIIYIPNLNKDLQYFTSFLDFSYQNRWMNLLVSKASKHLTIIPLQKDYSDEIIKMVGEETYKKDKGKYDRMIAEMNAKSRDDFPLIKDLTYICQSMGCSSPYGEDLEELVPTVSKGYDDQLSNARAKGPYYPSKCLRADYYDKHMMKLDDSYKTNVKNELLKNVDAFQRNYAKVQRGENPSSEYSSTNMIDVIKGTASRYRNSTYKEGTGDSEYSKEYNRKIMAELAFRHNTYPGVQEITFPAFRVNEQHSGINAYTHFMPWGNILLKDEYILNEGDVLNMESKSMKSFNGAYELKFDSDSLSLFQGANKVKTIITGNFAKYNNKSLVLENGSLNIYGYENGNNDNRYSLYVSNANAISPLSIIVENTGMINVYDNGFNIIGSIDSNGFNEKQAIQ